MSDLLAQGTSREPQETPRQLGRLPFSRSTFERVGHNVGELCVTRHADIEQHRIEDFELSAGAAGLVVSLDRVALPMEESIAVSIEAGHESYRSLSEAEQGLAQALEERARESPRHP